MNKPLSSELIQKMDAYWRAANYLSVGQIYLYENPLLEIPLSLAHVKPRLLGHWGTTPWLNFVYVHLNRMINTHDLNMLCLRSRNYVNVIVAGKQPSPQWLNMDAAIRHCTAGLGIWDWASNDEGHEPDLVMACAGDVPTMETLAAVEILRQHCPTLKIRVINVVDLMTLQSQSQHPHGLSDKDFDALFTKDKPTIFAYHGYPALIHKLTYNRANHRNLHVHGFKEEGTTTTPFDMVALNELDRFHLAKAAIGRVPGLAAGAADFAQFIDDKLVEHTRYIRQQGEDMPEIRNWQWGANGAGPKNTGRT